MNLDERPNVTWSQVQAETARNGTEWRIAPPGSQNRDGRSERAIAALKKTMKHLYVSKDLNLLEFQTLVRKAANCLNDRPLSVYDVEDGEPGVAPLTPNLMLFNAKAPSPVDYAGKYEEGRDKLLIRWKYVMSQYADWWSHWYRAVFANLVPYKRWKTPHTNLKPGDVCLLRYKGKIPPADYRLCRVEEVYPDKEGLVRTVKIVLVAKDKRRDRLPHAKSSLTSMTVAVQRLVLIYSEEEEKENQVISVNAMQRHWPIMH